MRSRAMRRSSRRPHPRCRDAPLHEWFTSGHISRNAWDSGRCVRWMARCPPCPRVGNPRQRWVRLGWHRKSASGLLLACGRRRIARIILARRASRRSRDSPEQSARGLPAKFYRTHRCGGFPTRGHSGRAPNHRTHRNESQAFREMCPDVNHEWRGAPRRAAFHDELSGDRSSSPFMERGIAAAGVRSARASTRGRTRLPGRTTRAPLK